MSLINRTEDLVRRNHLFREQGPPRGQTQFQFRSLLEQHRQSLSKRLLQKRKNVGGCAKPTKLQKRRKKKTDGTDLPDALALKIEPETDHDPGLQCGDHATKNTVLVVGVAVHPGLAETTMKNRESGNENETDGDGRKTPVERFGAELFFCSNEFPSRTC